MGRKLNNGPTILALDLSSTNTGYCVGHLFNRVVAYGSIKPATREHVGALFQSIIDQVVEVYKQYNCSFIVVEELNYFRNANTTRLLAGLRGAVVYAIWQMYQLEIIFVSPPEIKKWVGLSGNADKIAVQKLVVQLGFKPNNFDESDAISIFLAAQKILRIVK